jgi:hypothetical protein
MILKIIGAALLLGAGLLPAPALAQGQATAAAPQTVAPTRHVTAGDLDGGRSQLRDSRKETVAQNLRLTPDEATRFWPLYDQYAAELTKIKNDQYALIAEYANTYGKYDDTSAMSYIARWVDIDVRTTALRARYVPLIGKVLPGIKAATFIQIDRRLGMAIDLQIGRNLSVLQAQNGN